MISINNISVFISGAFLFKEASAFVGDKERIGLTGKNGAGKSTLLKLMAGQSDLKTEGSIARPKGLTIGYLQQYLHTKSDKSILQECLTSVEGESNVQQQIDDITEQLNSRTDYESDAYTELITQLSDLNHQLVLSPPEKNQEKAERILKGLGFTRDELFKPYNSFSGGWKMRVELAKILLVEPSLLLLDEPTNHLDLESIAWFEEYLMKYPGSIILISHDKKVLDNVTKRTLEISNGKIYDYPYAYSKYLIERQAEIERQQAAKKNQEKEIKQTEQLIEKFRAKASKASFAQSLIKKLERTDIIEVDSLYHSGLNIRFQPPVTPGKIILEINGLEKSYGSKNILHNIDLIIPRGEKILLTGRNGAGKSTLIKCITGVEPHKGEIKYGHNVLIGYYAQDEISKLDEKLTVYDTVDQVAEGDIRKGLRNILGSFLFSNDDIDKQVSVLSGGERARLALCKLLLKPYNFIILDEPTNHLDIQSKEILKQALVNFEGTVLVVSHDRDFLDGLGTRIVEVKQHRVSEFLGTIQEFLDAKHAASLRDFEDSKAAKVLSKETIGSAVNKEANGSSKEKETENIPLDREKQKELRKIKNDLAKVEKSIEEIELKIEDINSELANKSVAVDEITKLSKALKDYEKQLEQKMKEWEDISISIETFA
ncbi:MAG: ABC-F family ATP-binding cassette domain-containing protein [Luteibaculaceae bacterium]